LRSARGATELVLWSFVVVVVLDDEVSLELLDGAEVSFVEVEPMLLLVVDAAPFVFTLDVSLGAVDVLALLVVVWLLFVALLYWLWLVSDWAIAAPMAARSAAAAAAAVNCFWNVRMEDPPVVVRLAGSRAGLERPVEPGLSTGKVDAGEVKKGVAQLRSARGARVGVAAALLSALLFALVSVGVEVEVVLDVLGEGAAVLPCVIDWVPVARLDGAVLGCSVSGQVL
jgi:hypothetical protein